MNSNEIVDKIIETLAESIAGNYQIVNGELQKLESEQPKLRHLDYGFHRESMRPYIHINCDGKLRPVGDKYCFTEQESSGSEHYVILGNLADDLSAMSEDVEEFEIEGLKMILDNNCIKIGIGTSYKYFHVFKLDTIQEIHRKLGAMIATAKRKAGG